MSKDPGRIRSGLPVSLDEYRLLDTAQMAEATGYCVAQILRLTKAGKFPKPRRIGRRYLWPASVLVEIAGGRAGGTMKVGTPPPTGAESDRDEPVHHHHGVEVRDSNG